MIRSFQEIDAAIRAGPIVIDPRPDQAAWTSTAIDLTLNNVLLEWLPPVAPSPGGDILWPRPHAKNVNVQAMMDDDRLARRVESDPAKGYELKARSFVLGFTREIVQLPVQSRIAARVEGKSSLARVGVGVPVTAPTIHAGFGVDPNQPDQRGTVIELARCHNILNGRIATWWQLPLHPEHLYRTCALPRDGSRPHARPPTNCPGPH
jgi:dCTP deaminase